MPGDVETLSQVLVRMLERGAREGLEAHVQTSAPAELSVLDSLHSHGMVVQSDQPSASPHWRLTSHGAGSIKYTWRLRDPRKVLDVRPSLSLTDATAWELILIAESSGWLWMPMVGSKRPLPFCGKESRKIWYTSGHTVLREYLQCLLDADRTLKLVDGIEHGATADYYRDLLDGKRPVGKKRKRHSRKPAFQDDMASPAPAQAVATPAGVERHLAGQPLHGQVGKGNGMWGRARVKEEEGGRKVSRRKGLEGTCARQCRSGGP